MNSNSPDNMDDVMALFQRLQVELEAMCIRGVQSAATDEIRWLDDTQTRLAEAGAGYLAGVVATFVDSLRHAPRDAPRKLLELLTVARVFERVETLDTANAALTTLKTIREDEGDVE